MSIKTSYKVNPTTRKKEKRRTVNATRDVSILVEDAMVANRFRSEMTNVIKPQLLITKLQQGLITMEEVISEIIKASETLSINQLPKLEYKRQPSRYKVHKTHLDGLIHNRKLAYDVWRHDINDVNLKQTFINIKNKTRQVIRRIQTEYWEDYARIKNCF